MKNERKMELKKIEIFDPVMCCSTGVCGPSVDPELVRVANAIFLLEKKDVDIQRYNLANEPNAFVSNSVIQKLLDEKGTEALPATLIDGELMREGSYPTTEELAEWGGVKKEELTVGASTSKTIDFQISPK